MFCDHGSIASYCRECLHEEQERLSRERVTGAPAVVVTVPVASGDTQPLFPQLAAQEHATDIASAFADLPDQLRAHPGVKRLYRCAVRAAGAGVAPPPAGYKLMPLEPTPEMIAAAESVEDLYRRGTPETWRKVYRAMLAADGATGAPAQIDESKLPPRPTGHNGPDADPDSPLVRYGRASRDSGLLLEPMADGYWTPWHIANELLRAANGVLVDAAPSGLDREQLRRIASELEELNVKLHGTEHNSYRPGIVCAAALMRAVAGVKGRSE